MRILFITLSFFLLLALSNCKKISGDPVAPSKEETALRSLADSIEVKLSKLEGTFAVQFSSIDRPELEFSIHPDTVFHAASTMKTPVLFEILKQHDLGIFLLSDSLLVTNRFTSIVDGSPYGMQISEDSEADLYAYLGKKKTVLELAELMITQSSNLATNLLMERYKGDLVTNSMRLIGAEHIQVLRGVEDLKAFSAGRNNETTARDLWILFNELTAGSTLSKSSKNLALDILSRQEFNDMFPAKLPIGTRVEHKTGWITGVHHDSGIIHLPNGETFILIFLSKNAPNRSLVQEAAADIARMLYHYLLAYPDWDLELKKAGLVQIEEMDSTIMVHLAYSSTDNILGYDAYGSLEHAYLQKEAAQKLVLAQSLLTQVHPEYRLFVFDAARPRRIQQELWDHSDLPIAERSRYIANPQNGSIHNFGMAVDVGVYDIRSGLLDMGSEFDDFSQVSHINREDSLVENGYLSEAQLAHRILLRDIMVKAGFEPLDTEWWHFDAMERSRTKELFSIIE